MATKTNPVEKPSKPKESSTLFDGLRKVLLATIGAVALAQDEMEDFVQKLIERGEIAEKDGRKLIDEVKERRKKTQKGAEEEANKRVKDVLDHLNVATKKDIDDLGEKVTTLAKKVEELKKPQE
jgi:poly(hydroxyalkanoate) granule-associated protein